MPTGLVEPQASNAAPGVTEPRPNLSELPQFLGRIARFSNEFLIYDDGYRGWMFRYQDIGHLAGSFATRLRALGVVKGDAVVIWSESRPGWIVALWACLLEGVIVVPVDSQSSLDFFFRVRDCVRPRLLLQGDRVPAVTPTAKLPVWRVAELETGRADILAGQTPLLAEDVAEIVFTSGTTAAPKGVIITQRNLTANLRPLQDQFAPYLKYVRPFAPLRILNLLPLSHLFGQALATFVPPLIPASVVFISSTSAREIVRQIRSRRVHVLVAVPKVLEVLREFVVYQFPKASNAASVAGSWPWR